MEKLKVGDKVYRKNEHRFSDNIYYAISEVERLTKTQAILKDGNKIVNEPIKYSFDNAVGYPTYGDRWERWYILTDEILEEAKKEKARQKVNNWFSSKKFTDEEKQSIYKLLNPTT